MPLSKLCIALRSSGLRLQAEDVRDVEVAAAPFAPLTLPHFVHFAEQALGRHTYDDEVCAAFDEVAADLTAPVSVIGVSPNKSRVAGAEMSLEQVKHLLCGGQGDALSEQEVSTKCATALHCGLQHAGAD